MSTASTIDRPPATGDPSPGGTRPARRGKRPGHRTWREALRRDWQLYTLAILPLLFFLVFRYLPMIGNVIAFRRFEPGGNILGEEWVGLRYVRMFLNDPTFWNVFANTVILGALTLVVCFPLPIVLALLLNELVSKRIKRFVQSVSYLPHFLSTVVVAGMVMELVSLDGPINQVLRALGGEPIAFLQEPE